jgi:tRNA modification GTPase
MGDTFQKTPGRDLSKDRDTIFALSSGRPPAAIAVVRISGPRARLALEATADRVPEPRRAAFARLHDPHTKELIDEGLVLWFPGPQSETGEDVAELQVHGGSAILAALLGALGRLEGFRLAEPGEFTRRAFDHGRLDLTAVEGLADLIYAETEGQRRQALRQFKGLLGDRAESWRSRLIGVLALIEAAIDFSDEGDVPEGLRLRALDALGPLAVELREASASGRGERLREGLRVAIAGPPNVGKSTLLNRLARREAAIVSPHAGTTRDVIEVRLDLAGFPVTLLDTAGLREATDPVEQEGVRRAWDAVTEADLVLWVIDPVCASGSEQFAEVPIPAGLRSRIVLNKVDLFPAGLVAELMARFEVSAPSETLLTLSALSGAGVDDLVQALTQFAAGFFTAEPALVTRERHRVVLRAAGAALDEALRLGPEGPEELLAEQVRMATRALELLTGRIGVEDILDVIFRDFCIGK